MDTAEEIEQGDILWGVPSLVAAHPAVQDAFLAPQEIPTPEQLAPPARSDVLRGVRVHADPVLVVPHTCDFFGPEKGRGHRDRLVARVVEMASAGIHEPELLRSGDGYGHTFLIPDWRAPTDNGRDWFANLRQMTTVDVSYLSRERRLARLSRPAVIALRRRLTQFFSDYAPMPAELVEADVRGGLLRDSRALISVEELRGALGAEETSQLLRRLYNPRKVR